MKRVILIVLMLCLFFACNNESKTVEEGVIIEEEMVEESINPKTEVIKKQTLAELKAKLAEESYQTFDYVDEKTKDTILMQQYFIAFLKQGPIRNQSEEESARLQKAHLAHLSKMYELGYADISGPFGDDGVIRGITIYNVPTLKMADSLANADPMVKAGLLDIEVHPWWAGKGFPLR